MRIQRKKEKEEEWEAHLKRVSSGAVASTCSSPPATEAVIVDDVPVAPVLTPVAAVVAVVVAVAVEAEAEEEEEEADDIDIDDEAAAAAEAEAETEAAEEAANDALLRLCST